MDDAEFNLLLDKATFKPQINSVVELYRQRYNKSAKTCSLRHEDLEAANTEDWLKLEGDYAAPENLEIDHRLRLLLFHRDIGYEFVEEAPLPLRRSTFEAVHEIFGLPKQFLRVFQEGWGSFAKFTNTNSAHKDTVSFVMRSYPSASLNFSLAISYDIQRQCTSGVLAGLAHSDIQILTTHLRCLNDCCDNPMLVPLILCLMTTDRDGQGFDDLSTTLAELEQLSGLHHLKICRFPVKPIVRQGTILAATEKTEPVPPLIGQYSKIDSDLPSPANYDLQVRQLNEISTSIHLYEIRVEYLLRTLSSLCGFIRYLASKSKKNDGYSSTKLEENAQFLKSTNQNMLGDVRFQARRASNQINVVYSLINQRGAKLNLAVAADSRKIALATKKDSSAMKTISFLSIMFLPGTFFATLFSMTMFDWQAENKVVSKWIWVYAALTLPVTFILLITWLLFMKKNRLQHKEQKQVVAETYGDV